MRLFLIFAIMKSTIKTNWPKYLLQWGVLAAISFTALTGSGDPEAYCPVGGLQALTTYGIRGSLPCSMSSAQILAGILAAAAVILFSKLFCAFLCPVGAVEDLLTKLRKSLGIKDAEVRSGSFADKALRLPKYALLFWVFYSTAGASELFCRRFDPYYAAVTGFKGEIVLWMSIAALALLVIGGLFVKRFWCRYICPMGALSNTLKFWLPLLMLAGAAWGLTAAGLGIEWWWWAGAVCLLGYILEAFYSRPKLQLMHVVLNEDRCGRHCYACRKNCPYNIDIPAQGVVTSVDCTLCGECVAACPSRALHIGIVAKPIKARAARFIPAILTVVLVALCLTLGKSFEVPTIDVRWGETEGLELATMKVSGLSSIHCYGSSMAFKGKMEKVPGVYGVKTFAGSHTVVLTYDTAVTNEEKLTEAIYEPSHFRVNSPDPGEYKELKIQTIRTEHMPNRTDLNYLGLQMRLTGRKIFGLESEYDCPLIIRVYMAPDEDPDEDWYREIVEMKVLAMPVHGGGVKETPVDFTFVRKEKGEGRIGIAEYLDHMFDHFKAEFNGRYPDGDTTVVRKRAEVYAGKPQWIYEICDPNYEKPIVRRGLPFLSNHLSKEEGVIGIYLTLNKDLQPCIQVRFASPMTAQRVRELMDMDTWSITYAPDDVREVGAKLSFEGKEGKTYEYTE